jgi:polysaccharide deacetylase 2 family uncharacterized protein YibQ
MPIFIQNPLQAFSNEEIDRENLNPNKDSDNKGDHLNSLELIPSNSIHFILKRN